MTFRLYTIVGARPQFIKAAAFSRALQKYPQIEEAIIHTGQHFDSNMSDIFFEELKIPKPKYTLDIQGGYHGQMTGRMLESIESIFLSDKPDAVLVYGDTNSTLAGALAASKLHIPVIHIEAGLRSFNKEMPEEINRILADHVSSYLFCPTQTAVDNLKKEGISQAFYHVGDIMYDATLYALAHVENDILLQQKMSYLPAKFVLMTVHRAESTDDKKKFRDIINYANQFANEHGLKIVFPVHPRTKQLINQTMDNFLFIEPLSYFETQFCLARAEFVLTDSGGLQKEAYFHRVPCVTLRSETEWVETVTHGWNRLWRVDDYKMRREITEYGIGCSAEEIIKNIVNTCL